MNREQAEKLLAALIFDDLDDASRAELLAYLQTDDELRDRLADMRMTAKLARDAVNDGPEPVLNEHRLERLKRLARTEGTGGRVLSLRGWMAVAAVLVVGLALMAAVVVDDLSGRGVTFALVEHTDKARVDSRKLRGSRGPAAPMVVPVPSAPSSTPAYALEQRIADDLVGIQTGNGYAGMGGMADSGGGMKGGMGGMGGYGGLVAKELRSSASGATGLHGIETTGGQSLAEQRVVASDASSPAQRQADPSLGLTLRRRAPLSYESPGKPSKDEAESLKADMKPSSVLVKEPVAFEMNGAPHSGQPLPGLAPTDDSLASAKRSAGPVDEEEARRGLVRMKAAESGGESRYGWPGAVMAGTPSVAVTTPTPEVSGRVPDERQVKSSDVTEYAGAAEPVPMLRMLSDMPLDGSLLVGKSFDVRLDSGTVGLEPGGGVRGPSDMPAIQLSEETATSSRELRERRGQLTEPNDAGVPSVSHFKVVTVNPWVMTAQDPLSTFALDVDTASYGLCRRYIRSGFLPPIGVVRMEEFINAFDYAYPQRDDATFAVYAEGAPSPFAPAGQDLTLLKVAVKARTVGRDQRRAAHMVFVIDASASMGQVDRLPLVQSALTLLVDKLSEADRVSLVTCAGEARLHLEAVPAGQKDAIRQTIEAIQPAGSTNLMAGLRLGYAMARKAFVAGRINQVVLCSDGVANVGQTQAEAILQEVAEDRKQGITLTCVGVGYGAYNDAFLESMADHGDGRYVFLDSSEQARETLVSQLAATLQTVAKDARIQVRFNPSRVRRYRLVGYENRDIEDQRFRDDTIDAGEVGSGQCSTALYELELTANSSAGGDSDLGTVFVRYRHGETGQIEEISRGLSDSVVRRRSVEEDPRFFLAAGAARFAEWLRQSEHARQTSLADIQRVLDQVNAALPLDRDVQDLATLAHQAENLPRAPQAAPQP